MRIAALGGLMLCVLLAGCSSGMVAVSGQVVYEDTGVPIKELKGCTITFTSDALKKSARGTIDVDGRFRLGTMSEQDGVPAGTYKVTVTQHRRQPEREYLGDPCVLDIYEDPQTTPIVQTVGSGSNDFTIKLKRRKAKA